MAQLEQVKALAKEGVEALSGLAQDADWVKAKRLEAWARFEALPLPNHKAEEAWRRTNVSHLTFDGLVAYAPAEGDLPEWVGGLAGDNALVQHNSETVAQRLSAELAEKGVILTSLSRAAKEHADLVEPVLFEGVLEDKFVALNGATWAGGVFLYVPKNVEVKVPLQSVYYANRSDLNFATHTLIITEPGARVQFVEAFTGEAGLHTHVVSIHAKPNSSVEYSCLQDFEPGTKSFIVRNGWVGNDATVNYTLAEFGGSLVRAQNTAHLHGQGGSSNAVILLFGSGEQHMDIGQEALHTADYTHSDLITRAVLTEASRVIYRAWGHVEDGSKESKAYQTTNSLLLSPDARNDAIPSLIIHDADVAGAGHAATAGQVDEEQLFYLNSRGIPREKAIRMIVDGFLAPIFDLVPVEAVREEMRRLVDRKMGDA